MKIAAKPIRHYLCTALTVSKIINFNNTSLLFEEVGGLMHYHT